MKWANYAHSSSRTGFTGFTMFHCFLEDLHGSLYKSTSMEEWHIADIAARGDFTPQ